MQFVTLFLYMFMFMNFWTGYPALDRYKEGGSSWYAIINLTTLEMLELLVLLGCFYTVRNYPKEFMVKQELLFTLVVNFILSQLAQNTYANPGFSSSLSQCYFGAFTGIFTLSMLRLVLFVGYLTYISRNCFFYFPLPFAWIFKDLSKFVFEPYCIRIFEAYLNVKEPNSSDCLTQG